MKNKCKNCKAFVEWSNESSGGECRRHPPTNSDGCHFPDVDKESWCLDFVAKDEEVEVDQ